MRFLQVSLPQILCWEALEINFLFWQNRFTVDEGPLRRLVDPANLPFLEVEELNIKGLVIGFRLELTGFQGKQGAQVKLFAKELQLSDRFPNLAYVYWDDRLTSVTGSGKTLAYLLPIFAKVMPSRAAVQAIVVVPTRELGMQVARVAWKLAGKGGSEEDGKVLKEKGTVMVMTLLEGGTSRRQIAWLKAEPPQIVVGTLERIACMIETKNLRTNAITTIVIDEYRWML